ncbi:MAG: hypothetical protein RL211_282 [Pseudomonadota bacterium]|jgi:uncharacterized membrane protein YedE/YeeE
MQVNELPELSQLVLCASFILSVLFGAIAQRTHFCTMGAISDVVNMKDWTRMRQWGLAAGVAMIGYALLAFSGQIDPSKAVYASGKWLWLSAIVGGSLFGFGMVLASGCGSKTLVRIGGGNLKSLVVMIVMSVAGFATLKGVAAVLRVATVDQITVDFSINATVGNGVASMLGMTPLLAGLLAAVILGGSLIIWALSGRDFNRADNLLAGLGLGLVVVAMWWVSGQLGHIAEHPETLDEVFLTTNSGKMEAMSFVAPMAYTLDWLILFSDKSKVLTFSVASVLGVIVGSATSAIVNKTFRWEGFNGGAEDLANHLAGAVLMGVGGVTAMGCTVGQGLSGISTLHATSFIAVIAIMAGAMVGLKYQIWRLERVA